MIVQANGWGIQSVYLLWQQALGLVDHVDVALFSDTTHEKAATYAYIQKWQPVMESYGLKFATVQDKAPQVHHGTMVDVPAFTRSEHGRGQIRRQCTKNWKIYPMRRYFQEHRSKGEQIELWLGISKDEYQRMSDSDRKYIRHRWPLIELGVSRSNCIAFLQAKGIELPPKSSCVFCPFQSAAAWRELKAHGNGDWTKAVEIDNQIRNARPPQALYVHQARKPLEEIDLRTPQEKGQLSLWDNECSGICGV